MDIEWAKDGNDGKLYIVQARPETVKSREDSNSMERFQLLAKAPVLVEGRAIGQRIGAGTAKVLKGIEQMDQIQPGDVLVTDMTDPDQQRRSTGETGFSGPADSSSYLKARTALTVYQAQERQLAIQKKKGALVDRSRAETLVFRLARQEREVWVTWPARVAALMAADVAAEVEKQSGQPVRPDRPVIIEAAILQRVLEAHVRQHLDDLADLRVSLG